MSLSLYRLLTDAKVKRTITLCAVLFIVAIICHSIFSRPNKELLIKDLNARLRDEKFEQLYEEADDSVRLNVTKERFVKRMKMTVAKLKALDANLVFERDRMTEKWMGRDGPVYYSIATIQKLKKDGKSVTVCFTWSEEGAFFDLSVHPSHGTSQEFAVPGVSSLYYSVGNRKSDW